MGNSLGCERGGIGHTFGGLLLALCSRIISRRLGELDGVLGIEPGSAECKASTITTVLSNHFSPTSEAEELHDQHRQMAASKNMEGLAHVGMRIMPEFSIGTRRMSLGKEAGKVRAGRDRYGCAGEANAGLGSQRHKPEELATG